MNTALNADSPAAKSLYRFNLSGHCHRVELFLSLLGQPYQTIDVDLPNKAHKQPDFLKLNPFGEVPVLRDGDAVIADSNAILIYLARKYGRDDWLPTDALRAAAVQRWLSVAAGPLAFGPAAARRAVIFKSPVNVQEAIDRSRKLFEVMNAHLHHSPFLVGDAPTIADIANYSYVAHAPEGAVSLEPYPALNAWLKRIEALPGFVAMRASAIPMPA